MLLLGSPLRLKYEEILLEGLEGGVLVDVNILDVEHLGIILPILGRDVVGHDGVCGQVFCFQPY